MSAAVHIRYLRSGGIGGLRMTADVDTGPNSPLDADLRTRIDELAAAVLSAPSPTPGSSGVRDGFQYDLTFDMGGKERRLQAADPLEAGALEQLIETLDALATPAPRSKR